MISKWTQTLLIKFRANNLCYVIYHHFYSSIFITDINNWLICFYFCFLRDTSNPLNVCLHCWAHTYNFVNSSGSPMWDHFMKLRNFQVWKHYFDWYVFTSPSNRLNEGSDRSLFVSSRMMFTVQYYSSLVIYHKRGKQWVSQQCGWQCVTNTQRHLLGVCSTKIDCASRRSLSVGFSPVFVLSPPLLSFPLLRTEEDVRCQNKNEMLEGTEEEKWSVCPLVGSGPNLELHLKSLFLQLVIAYKAALKTLQTHI